MRMSLRAERSKNGKMHKKQCIKKTDNSDGIFENMFLQGH